MKLIGLTGSIATGKSTVAKIFKDLGFYVIDADKIAHSVYKRGEKAYFEIVKVFGKEILHENGEINRKKLGRLVLNDNKKLSLLEAIVHPAVEEKRLEMLEKIKNEDPHAFVISDVPLLLEKDLKSKFDCIIVVYVPKELQIRRLMERDHILKEEALKKVSLQLPINEKRKLADIVIDNSKTLAKTRKQVESIVEKIKNGELC